MNSSGQSFQGIIMGFVLMATVILLAICIVPLFNAVAESQLPLLNSMTNYAVFAGILLLIPVLIVVLGFFTSVGSIFGYGQRRE